MIFFDSNRSAIKALEKLQKIDSEQIQIVSSRLEELQKGQFFKTEEIQNMQEHLNNLQERLTNVEKKWKHLQIK
ncbi:MAG: hypothetical protein ACR5KW_00715 [Wolbachia sp.]